MKNRIILFFLATAFLAWVSRASLRDTRQHGFYRFFAWEAILVLFLTNAGWWFVDPFGARQIAAWSALTHSLALIIQGLGSFRARGQVDPAREGPGLVGIEKTTRLVNTGVYRTIRHPFYSSLLFLAWGILLKHITWSTVLLAAAATYLLVVTARIEEGENLRYFGEPYRAYMRKTKMFVPFIF